jgi:hypothetical protein
MSPRDLAARVTAASEALEVGDVEHVRDLLADLERELFPRRNRFACECGLTFEWPGLLDRHHIAGVCA